MLLISLTPLSVVRCSSLEHVRALPPDSSGEIGGVFVVVWWVWEGVGCYSKVWFFLMFEMGSLRAFLFCYSCLWFLLKNKQTKQIISYLSGQ